MDQDSPPSSGCNTPFSLENCLQFFFSCCLEGAGNLGTPHPLVTGMGMWPRPGQVKFSLGLAQEVGVRRTEKRREREREEEEKLMVAMRTQEALFKHLDPAVPEDRIIHS